MPTPNFNTRLKMLARLQSHYTLTNIYRVKKGDVVFLSSEFPEEKVVGITEDKDGSVYPLTLWLEGKHHSIRGNKDSKVHVRSLRDNPALSEKQRKLWGMIVAYKEKKIKEVSPKVKEIAKRVALSTAKEFAKSLL